MPDNQIPAADEPTVLMAAALDDWWITTDPLTQFHAPAVAHHIGDYLAHHGYTITRAAPATVVPTRLHVVTGLFIALMAGLATALCIRLDLWVWAFIGAAVAVLTSHEAVKDITARLITRGDRR